MYLYENSKVLNQIVCNLDYNQLCELADHDNHPDKSDFANTIEAWNDGWESCSAFLGTCVARLRSGENIKIWLLSTAYDDDGFEFFVVDTSLENVLERAKVIIERDGVEQSEDYDEDDESEE